METQITILFGGLVEVGAYNSGTVVPVSHQTSCDCDGK